MGAADGAGGWLATAPATPAVCELETVVFKYLLAADCGGLRRLIGAVLLRGGLRLAEIQLRRHLRLDVVPSHHGLQNIHDPAGVLLLDLLHILQLLCIHTVTGATIG